VHALSQVISRQLLSIKLLAVIMEFAEQNPDLDVGDVLDALGDVGESVTNRAQDIKVRLSNGQTINRKEEPVFKLELVD